jgi:hypothetical protein
LFRSLKVLGKPLPIAVDHLLALLQHAAQEELPHRGFTPHTVFAVPAPAGAEAKIATRNLTAAENGAYVVLYSRDGCTGDNVNFYVPSGSQICKPGFNWPSVLLEGKIVHKTLRIIQRN